MSREPIINTAAVASAIGALIAFSVRMGWVNFDETQIAAIMTVVSIVLPLLVGIIARQWVSPVGQKVAAVLSEAETIAAKPETRTIVAEGEKVINDLIARAPAESAVAAVAVTPTAPPAPDGAPVQPATPAPAV